MNKLYVIKMYDGSNVMAEVDYDDANYIYQMRCPVLISSMYVQGLGETSTSLPYLPGVDNDILFMPSSFVVTMSLADPFYSKFYGSTLLKFYTQKVMKSLGESNRTELNADDIYNIDLKRIELKDQFGLITEEPEKRTIH